MLDQQISEVLVDLGLLLLAGLYVFAFFVVTSFFYQRARYRRRKRLGKGKWGFYPGSASMGNALQQLSVILQPQVQHVLEEKQSADAEEDDEGAPSDPTAHLLLQAERIRRGEKLDRLTAIRKDRQEGK
jgi:hypothetical protein